MGIDCDIVMKMKEGATPENPSFDKYYEPDNGYLENHYSIDIGQRYYSPDYPRGNFPLIAKAILEAIGDENCEKVFLANDFGLGEEITPEYFMILCKTWYVHESRQALRKNPERNQSWNNLTTDVPDLGNTEAGNL